MCKEGSVGLIMEDCCECSFLFWVPEEFYNRRREDGKSFFCPSCGTSQHYSESTEDVLKRKIEKLAAQNDRLNKCCDEQFEETQQIKYSRAAYKAHFTRLRNLREAENDQAQSATG